MRILNIHKNYWHRDGASGYFLQLENLLRQHGHTVVPFSMAHLENFPTPYARYFVSEIDFRQRDGMVDSARKVARFLYSREARQKLQRLILEQGPFDVAHVHNIYHHLTPAILPILTRHHIPAVMTLHDYKLVSADYTLSARRKMSDRFVWGLERMLHQLLRSYDRHIARFITPSQYMLEYCVRAGWPRDRFVRIPYCLDIEAFAPNANMDRGYVVYAGRLSHEKGVEILLQTAARMRDVEFRIAGIGPEQEHLRAKTREHNLENVRFVGFLEQKKLRALIAEARVVAVPSLWPENYPFAVLEAQAMGKIVVASHVGGIPEQIVHGRTGFLVAPGDVSAWVTAVRHVMELSRDEREAIGQSARMWVASEHAYPVHYARLMEVYKHLH